jgi:putative PIN family toxin of toxin-antitoxin system
VRVVLDANVIISAVISPRGSPARILRLWEGEEFELIISPPILEELERVIHYPRIQEKYSLSEEYVGQFLQSVGSGATVVDPAVELSVIEKDPSDDRYLECAVASEASYIVTGDGHLLDLEEYGGIAILNPAEFLALVKLGGA